MGACRVRPHDTLVRRLDQERLRDGRQDQRTGRRLGGVDLETEMLARIKLAIAHHNATCPMPARAILLNTGNFELFGWEELFGLPVEPRDEVPPKRFRIDCPGSAWGIEDEIAEAVGEELPASVPVP